MGSDCPLSKAIQEEINYDTPLLIDSKIM